MSILLGSLTIEVSFDLLFCYLALLVLLIIDDHVKGYLVDVCEWISCLSSFDNYCMCDDFVVRP